MAAHKTLHLLTFNNTCAKSAEHLGAAISQTPGLSGQGSS